MTQTPQALPTDGQETVVPGTYDHTELHTKVYGLHGIVSVDNEIDRAWARLFDAGRNPGPALHAAFEVDPGTQSQYFEYAYATRDLSPLNVNKTVVFFFPGFMLTESGL